MARLVTDIMESAVTMVSVDSTVEAAEDRLFKYNMRFAPVVNDERNCFGVISFSDILRLRRSNINLKSKTMWEVCSPRVRSVSPGCTVDEATKIMLKHNIHHVLVLKDKQVLGIVSVMDILRDNTARRFTERPRAAAAAH